MLEAPDQNGDIQDLTSFNGSNGLILLFNRSFDWCPYCKAQLISLKEIAPEFSSMGFSVAIITYDPVETLSLVAENEQLDIPLLHDEAISSWKDYWKLTLTPR